MWYVVNYDPVIKFILAYIKLRQYYIYIYRERERERAVAIATRYGLDGPEIESRWRRDFPTCPDLPWGAPSLLCNAYLVFPGGKEDGAWR